MLGWSIILVPTAIIVMYIILTIVLKYNKTNRILRFLYNHEPKFFTATAISIVCVIIIAIVMLCSHGESRSFVAKYEGVAAEYEIRKDAFSALERVAAFNYAINLTAEISVYKFWDQYFDPFIPDSIHKLKPIR